MALTESFEHIRAGRPRRRPQLGDFDPRALAWLALAPAWPLEIAERGFPVAGHLATGDAVRKELERIAEAGFIELRESNSIRRAYSMGRTDAAEVVAWLTGSTEDPDANRSPRWTQRQLLEELSVAAKHALSAEERHTLSPAIFRWATLGSRGSLASMAELLDEKVSAALEEARAAEQMSCPEAVAWSETGQRLSALLEGVLEHATARTDRQLELFHRSRRDEKLLANYFERKDAEAALRELLSGSDDLWALHYIGVGGMGKTMLLRRIQLRSKELGIVTSRVDFDRLNPEYPVRAPHLLLLGFCEEFQLKASSEVVSLFIKFRRQMEQARQRIEGVAAEGASLETPGTNTEFREGVSLFEQALALLSREARPVLILDTCEELARRRPDGSLPPAIEKTFEILKRLHDAVPSLRVIFSGRRPLGRAGFEWSFDDGSHGETILPERAHLRLCEIRGFDRTEAHQFLERYRREGRPVPPSLTEPILARSVSPQHGSFRNMRAGAAPDGRDEQRYNPYDLDLYAAWAAEDDELTPDKLGAVHFYVKERILGRLSPELTPWLPELVAFGRFDRALFKSLTSLPDEQFAALWEDVRAQEWTDVDRGAISSSEVLMLDPNLLGKLRSYFAKEERSRWIEARRRAGSSMLDATLERPFRDLTPSYFASLLTLLEPTPAREWLDAVGRKVAGERQWGWLRSLVSELELVLDDADQAGLIREDPGVRATVLGLGAAVALRDNPSELQPKWTEVRRLVAPCSEEPCAQILAYRADVGSCASLRWNPRLRDDENVGELAVILLRTRTIDTLNPNDELLAAELELVTDACEIMERNAEHPGVFSISGALQHRLDFLLDALAALKTPPLWTDFARVQLGRATVLRGQRIGNESGVIPEEDGARIREYLDWRRPEDLTDRIELERARIAVLLGHSLPPFRDVSPRSIDRDRVESLRLEVRAATRVLRCSLEEARAALDVERSSTPECQAHRAVTPQFVVILEQHALRGHVGEVMAFLDTIFDDSTFGEYIVHWAERLLWRLVQRMRLLDFMSEPQTSVERSPLPSDRALLVGTRAFRAGNDSPFKGRWAALELKMPEEPASHSFETINVLLDEAEAYRGEESAAKALAAIEGWARRHPLDLQKRATLVARYRSLRPEDERSVSDAVDPTHQTPRRLAHGLLEEGPLAALRNPNGAAKLLEEAIELYTLAQDACGELLARLALASILPAHHGNWARALDAYETFRQVEQRTDLPEWRASDSRSSKWERIKVADPAWRPWLLRMLSIETWNSTPAPGESDDSREVGEQLLTLYSGRLPPGFPAPRPKAGPSPADGAASKDSRSRVAWLSAAALPIPVFILIQAGVWLSGGMLGPLASLLVYLLLFTPLTVASFRAQARGIDLIQLLLELSLNASLRGSRLQYRIRHVPQESGSLEKMSVEMTTNVVYFGLFRTKMRAPNRFAIDTESTYLEQSIQMRQRPGTQEVNTSGWIRRVQLAAKLLRLSVDLDVDRRCAPICWEAIIGQQGGDIDRLDEASLVFRRYTDPNHEVRERPPKHRLELCYSGWKINPWSKALPRLLDESRRFDLPEGNGNCAVLHVRGEIELVHNRLSFVEWRGSEAVSNSVRLELLLREVPSVELVILQGPPLYNASGVVRERKRASLFREAADYMFRSGVPAVIVLPPMSDELASEALALLATALDGRENRVDALRRATHEIRLLIDSQSGLERWFARELAYDVCYYSNSKLEFRKEARGASTT